jgi:hypothetical protein
MVSSQQCVLYCKIIRPGMLLRLPLPCLLFIIFDTNVLYHYDRVLLDRNIFSRHLHCPMKRTMGHTWLTVAQNLTVKLEVLSCVPESHGQLLHLSSKVAFKCVSKCVSMLEALDCSVYMYVWVALVDMILINRRLGLTHSFILLL